MKKIALFLALILLVTSVPTVWAEDGSLSNFSPSRAFPEGKFSDVRDTDWFSKFVKKAYMYSLIDGNSATTYNPGGNVTVAETLVIACNLNKIYFGREIPPAEGAWYAKFVNYAMANGIIRRGAYVDFNKAATRRQFASILADSLPEEAFEPIVEVQDSAIPDVKITDLNANKIYRLYRAGILGGSDSEGSFLPDSSIKRSEVATIISNIVDPSARGGQPREADSIGVTWQEFLGTVNQHHQTLTQQSIPRETVGPYLEDFSSTTNAFTDAQAEALITPEDQVEFITKAKAVEDVETLFTIYKAYYGSYGYFGGDAAYLPAKESVISAINAQNTKSIDTDWLAKTICESLRFVRDGHAFIGDYNFCNHNGLKEYDYYVPDLYFFKDDNGYFTRVNGKKAYLSRVGTDARIESYLRVSIDDIGRLCYILCVTCKPEDQAVKTAFVQFSSSPIQTLGIHWKAMMQREWNERASYQSISLSQSIPYVSVKDQEEGENRNAIRKKILDIHNLTSSQDIVIYDVLTATGYSRHAVTGKSTLGNDIEAYKISRLMTQIGETNVVEGSPSPGKYVVEKINGSWNRDNTLKFILQDDNNFSASEGFINAMKAVENAVLIGSTTGGGQITAQHHFFYLPNSHLACEAGVALRLIEDLQNHDGIGFNPDIWVDPKNAVMAIYKLCNFYGLENSASVEKIYSSEYYTEHEQAIKRESYIDLAPVQKQSDLSDVLLTLYLPWTGDTISPHKGFGFGYGTGSKTVSVLFNGQPIADYTFSLAGDNIGTVTKAANGSLVFAATSAGDCEVTITYQGKTAVFFWHAG
jgi:hypothetical protein